jgi:carbon monoxide dehydrogenase subunit G
MRLENAFVVPASPEAAWDLLMDVPRVIPCMPGAKLVETVDDETWKATMHVKLGPISLTFATDVKREESDEAGRRAKLSAQAREARGRGAARATIESWLEPQDAGTRVAIVTDLSMSGAVAQYGRGMIEDVSAQLVDRFAGCLEAQLSAAPEAAEAAVAEQARPVSGLRLGMQAFGGAVARSFRRVVRRLGRRRG